MSIKEEYSKLLAQRKQIDEIDYKTNPIIISSVNLMSKDIEKTIEYLLNECSEDEFIWLSEIFEEIAQKTKSQNFILALREISKKYPVATSQYNIAEFIDDAEKLI